MSEESQKIANSGVTSPVDLKAMFAELLDAKRDILAHVQDSICCNLEIQGRNYKTMRALNMNILI